MNSPLTDGDGFLRKTCRGSRAAYPHGGDGEGAEPSDEHDEHQDQLADITESRCNSCGKPYGAEGRRYLEYQREEGGVRLQNAQKEGSGAFDKQGEEGDEVCL